MKRGLKRFAALTLAIAMSVELSGCINKAIDLNETDESTQESIEITEPDNMNVKLSESLMRVTEVIEKTEELIQFEDDLSLAIDNLLIDREIKNLEVQAVTGDMVTLSWSALEGQDAVNLTGYRIYWADKDTPGMKYKLVGEVNPETTSFTYHKPTYNNHFFKVSAVYTYGETKKTEAVMSPVANQIHVNLEELKRGIVATYTSDGIFISWRLMADEVTGYSDTGLVGTNFNVYWNNQKLATVKNSTNYFHAEGDGSGIYYIVALDDQGNEVESTKESAVFATEDNYIDIPISAPKPEELPDMVLSQNADYSYRVSDVSIGDMDGDNEYEYIVKWVPTNLQDVSVKGYTGKTYFDCYKLDGTILWRIDMGVNIRSGNHYSQFVVADFNGDGVSEIGLQTAPGSSITVYNEEGTIKSKQYITLPQKDVARGVTHEDDYRLSAVDFKEHFTRLVMNWGDWSNEFWKENSSELTYTNANAVREKWDKNIENLWWYMYETQYRNGQIDTVPEKLVNHDGPYTREEAERLAEFFYTDIQPYKSGRNVLDEYEGYIIDGPEYITIFSGKGVELDTQPVRFPREDDGLLWGDYAWDNIEPANRSERHNAGAAFLDGENMYLVMARGYYTRSTIAAFTLNEKNKLEFYWDIDSGWIEMENPFFIGDGKRNYDGNDPVDGAFASQGDHTISFADVDGDRKQEIIYGGAIVDHDGSLYSSGMDYLPDGRLAKYGHGDALHVADIDPDYPGLEIFSCFEEGKNAPYGTALRDAESNEVIFGDYSGADTSRAMVGDLYPEYRGLETWGFKTRTADGKYVNVETIGTNQNIRWAADMSTSIFSPSGGIEGIKDGKRILLQSVNGTIANDTKICLAADVLGDWREELIVQKDDSKALRIYTNDEVTSHKLYTLVHNPQYRAQITAQQSVYNQPSYPSFYLAADTEWEYVWVPNISRDLLVNHKGQTTKSAAVERKEIPEVPEISVYTKTYEEQEWKNTKESIGKLNAKLSLMDEDEYDISLIDKMITLKEQFHVVEGMPLADFSRCEEMFVKISAMNPDDYSVATFNTMVDEMEKLAARYLELSYIVRNIGEATATINMALAGVDLPKTFDYLSFYFDFAMSEASGYGNPRSTYGYLDVYGDAAESLYAGTQMGYGLEALVGGRNRDMDHTLTDDFIMDAVFYVDIKNPGLYLVDFYHGDATASNTTTGSVSINGTQLVEIETGTTDSGIIGETRYLLDIEEAGILKIAFEGRMNALHVEEIISVDETAEHSY